MEDTSGEFKALHSHPQGHSKVEASGRMHATLPTDGYVEARRKTLQIADENNDSHGQKAEHLRLGMKANSHKFKASPGHKKHCLQRKDTLLT